MVGWLDGWMDDFQLLAKCSKRCRPQSQTGFAPASLTTYRQWQSHCTTSAMILRDTNSPNLLILIQVFCFDSCLFPWLLNPQLSEEDWTTDLLPMCGVKMTDSNKKKVNMSIFDLGLAVKQALTSKSESRRTWLNVTCALMVTSDTCSCWDLEANCWRWRIRWSHSFREKLHLFFFNRSFTTLRQRLFLEMCHIILQMCNEIKVQLCVSVSSSLLFKKCFSSAASSLNVFLWQFAFHSYCSCFWFV